MIIIGIDPSINSTGICVWDKDKNTNIYYIIAAKLNKKQQNFYNKYVFIKNYNKIESSGDYNEKEYITSINIYNICEKIKEIILNHSPQYVIMEGISYKSNNSMALIDLAGLNFSIRYLLQSLGIRYKIVAPKSVKKFAISNGAAEKPIIIETWKILDKNIRNINNIKIDDLADSFFIAHYNE